MERAWDIEVAYASPSLLSLWLTKRLQNNGMEVAISLRPVGILRCTKEGSGDADIRTTSDGLVLTFNKEVRSGPLSTLTISLQPSGPHATGPIVCSYGSNRRTRQHG